MNWNSPIRTKLIKELQITLVISSNHKMFQLESVGSQLQDCKKMKDIGVTAY